MARKNIMRTFKINEISAVDRPAQSGAKMVIMKRNAAIVDEDLINKGATKTEDGKQFSSSDYAHVPDPSEPSTWKLRLTGTPGGEPDSGHVGAAAAALGPGFRGNKVELPTDARSKVVARVRSAWRKLNPGKDDKDMPEGLSKSNPLNEGESDMDPKEVEKMKNDLAKATADLEKAKKVGDLNDAEKAKYNSMSDKDKEDFLGKSAEDRSAILKNDAASNPVVYKSATGEEFRKNDDPRLVSMAKSADEANKLAKAEREARESSELKKRATDTFKNLPGNEDEKAALLKSIEAIPDEAVRKKALESVKAGDAALSAAFTRKGANDGTFVEKGGALDQLDTLAKNYAKDNKVTYAKAYDTVMQSPEGRELYAASLNK